MLNHVTLRVGDIEASKKFFRAALAPLGYRLLVEKEKVAGFGQVDEEGKRDFWIKERELGSPSSISCLAFTASSEKEVQEFYKEALSAGGMDNGAPGIRAEYNPTYYAAFVLSPDGHNIEALYEDQQKLKEFMAAGGTLGHTN